MLLSACASLALWAPSASAAPASKAPKATANAATTTGTPLSPADRAAADLLAKAESAEARNDLAEAISALKVIAKKYPTAAAAPKSQLKLAQLHQTKGNPEDAYAALTTYIERYPGGRDFNEAVKQQFDIATAFLGGQRAKVLGMRLAPSLSRAKEMFEGIVKRAPFHPLAAHAQFNVGQAYERMSQPSEALAAYQLVISRYPADPMAATAQYQVGFLRYKEAREGSYDREAREKAREAFEEFLATNPSSEKSAQARENLKELQGGDARGTLDIAKFYDKAKNFRAASIYYNEVLKTGSGTKEAEYARNRLAELKTQVGEEALRPGPEKVLSGAGAGARRKMQAKVDVASRPDYVGPAIKMPEPRPAALDPLRPRLPGGVPLLPPVEPALPPADPLLPPGSIPLDPLMTAPTSPGFRAQPAPGLGTPPSPSSEAKPVTPEPLPETPGVKPAEAPTTQNP
jgi:outer membrane protein assembly factor BamD